MATENCSATFSSADSDKILVVDGFGINGRDWFSLKDIFLDWGYLEHGWWKTAKEVIEIDETDPDRRVRKLRYPFRIRRRIDSLHPSIGQLKCLDELDLSYTLRLRTLPEEIWKLKNLIKLYLFESGITCLPPALGQLQNLQLLHLGYLYGLTTLPEEIGNLKDLIFLSLSGSGIKRLPSSIGKLQNIEELHLGAPRLTSLPEEIGNLDKLISLHLDDSKVTRLPPSICQLHNLEMLNLRNSKVICLPRKIGNL